MGVVGACAVFASRAEASPVAFGSNHYEFIQVTDPFTGDNNAWWTARDAAAAMTFSGVNGHLVTITSQAENDFLLSIAGSHSGFQGAWLGGKHAEGWLVGPEAGQSFAAAGYANFGGIEPNNAGYAYMNIGDTTFGIPSGTWADDSLAGGTAQGVPAVGSDPVVGYFVEYSGTAAVPEPGSFALLGSIGLIGLAGAAVRRRRRKRAGG